MITTLSDLKLILPVFALSAGISMLILLDSLISVFAVSPGKNRRQSGLLYEHYQSMGSPEMPSYEHIIRKEFTEHIWFLSAGGSFSMLLMTAAALFHRKIIAVMGTDFFILLCLILCISAVCCILLKNGWKSAACSDLYSYAKLFSAAAHDDHAGIRMMLSCAVTEIPCLRVMSAIQDDNPGISGTEVMRKAGAALGSGELSSVDNAVYTDFREENDYRLLRVFGSVLSVLAFGIILILCFLE